MIHRKTLLASSFVIIIATAFIFSSTDSFAQSQILKWKDGKAACVTLTYDDGTKNQFDIAIPEMDKLGFPGTFFINTVSIIGSKNQPTFVGRPMMEILEESATVPSNFENIFERTSMIRYLCEIQKIDELKEVDMYNIGSLLEKKSYKEVYQLTDQICAKLRATQKTYRILEKKALANLETSWDDLREFAKNGHEFANHTISHPHLSTLDLANILYETEKCSDDIRNNLGAKHTETIEGPYGIHDDRVMEILYPYYPFLRNRVPEAYFDEILRHDSKQPVKTNKEYIHWQRGPLSNTPYSLMTSWVDTSVDYNCWLVLVFHGIEGIGWEALPAERIKNYFHYIKEKEDQIWVATYQDSYKYIRERMNSNIEQTANEKEISIELSNELDKEIYNQALTLKTIVPSGWKSVQFKQGNTTFELIPQAADNSSFVTFDAMPNAGKIVLSKLN